MQSCDLSTQHITYCSPEAWNNANALSVKIWRSAHSTKIKMRGNVPTSVLKVDNVRKLVLKA